MDELLNLLKDNALQSPKDLAKMLGQTEEQVRAHILTLERKGVIRGYHAILNEDLLGMDRVDALIEVKITADREGGYDHVAQRISKFSEVDSVLLMSGGFDLLVFVKGRNLKEVAIFVTEKLASISGVLSTATHFMLKMYKDSGVLMQDEDSTERLNVAP